MGSALSELPASRPIGLCSASGSRCKLGVARAQACLLEVGLKVGLSVSLTMGLDRDKAAHLRKFICFISSNLPLAGCPKV